ncbi:MAG: dihydroorotase [Deltaproteobacteria bacterium]|nr:MAG: dihydroorotase [Deltaproteobacteria bacterium]
MLIRIKGGRVLDPGRLDAVQDIIISNGTIQALVSPGAPFPLEGDEAETVIDAAGCIVSPGLIDIHVHFRDPGFEYKETIETGSRAAVSGGFTRVCTMPNTRPAQDTRAVCEYVTAAARVNGLCHVHPVGAITYGLKGEALTEFADLKRGGAVAVTDDGLPVRDALLMRRAMEYARGFDLPVFSHSEDLSLAGKGVMNEGVVATRLGLAGIPNAAESVAVMRDIAISELTGARLHLCHISTRESVAAIRFAKSRGIPVTAETAPHYFTLTESAVEGYNTHAKMNPPLRTQADLEAVIEGLSDGTLDAIATDHAPHSVLEKDVTFASAANGIVGLETSLSLSLSLVRDGHLSMERLIAAMSTCPGEIIGFPAHIEAGAAADLTIIDPDRTYTVDAAAFCSKGRNTPFDGWRLRGRAVMTLVGGRSVFNCMDA